MNLPKNEEIYVQRELSQLEESDVVVQRLYYIAMILIAIIMILMILFPFFYFVTFGEE